MTLTTKYEDMRLPVAGRIVELEGWLAKAEGMANPLADDQDPLFLWISNCENAIFNLKALESMLVGVDEFKEYTDAAS